MTLKLVEEDQDGGTAPTKNFPEVQPGIYRAEVLEVTERDSFFWNDKDDHSKGKQREVNFKFAITEEPYVGSFVWGTTPTIFNRNERCRLRNWIQEIFGMDDLPVGFEMEYEDLVGCPVKVEITKDTWTDKTTGEMKSKLKVANLVRDHGDYEETLENAF